MDFWHSIVETAHMGSALPWVIITFVFVAFVLYLFDAAGRKRIRASIILLVIAFIGLMSAGFILSTNDHNEKIFAFRMVRDSSLMLIGTAIVTLIGVIIFDSLLGMLRLRLPAILQDLLLAAAFIVTNALILIHFEHGLTGLITTSAIGTAILGLALQSTFENVMGGMALQMDRTISVGDWIKLDQLEGVVKEIRWRQTSIETRDWNTVIIPNSQLMKGIVTVIGRRQGLPRQTRRWIYFQIDHGVPTNHVISLIEKALRDEPIAGVASDPLPNCILTDLRDAWQTFAVRYWLTDIPNNDPIDSQVRTRVIAALQRAGIGFSYPTQSLLMHAMDEQRDQRHHEKNITQRLAAIDNIPLFDPLVENERRELAERLHETPFVRGEIITRQGSHADCLYIIVKGDAEVRVSSDGIDLSKTVATLHTGDFFGEMALLTGATRTATVVAASDVATYRLDKDDFLSILQNRPAVAEAISHIVAQRQGEQDAAREHLDIQAQRLRMESTQGDLLRRIRSFFKI